MREAAGNSDFALRLRHVRPYYLHKADGALLLLLSQTARQGRIDVNFDSAGWVGRSLEKTSQRRESLRTNNISTGAETHTCFSSFSVLFFLPQSGPGPTSYYLVHLYGFQPWPGGQSSLLPASGDKKSSSQPFWCLKKGRFLDLCFCQSVAFLTYLLFLSSFPISVSFSHGDS